jgi:hypothetical protein
MTIDLVTIFANEGVLLSIKVALLIIEFLYGAFGFVIVRQVVLMGRTFKTEFNPFFKLLALINFFATLGLFILTFIIL